MIKIKGTPEFLASLQAEAGVLIRVKEGLKEAAQAPLDPTVHEAVWGVLKESKNAADVLTATPEAKRPMVEARLVELGLIK